VDTVHAHDLSTLPTAYVISILRDSYTVYDSHELFTETSTRSDEEQRFWVYVESNLITKADEVITVNKSISNELSNRYHIDLPKVILNCRKQRESDKLGRDDLLHQKADLDPEENIVLYQGGFSPNRGLETLIDASKWIDDATVVFMGWGSVETELRNRVEELDLEDSVKFIGPAPQADLIKYTRGAEIGVIPYQFVGLNNYYTTPNKLFEYMTAGIAIVGSDFPELKRIIEGQSLGATFDPESSRDIAEKINSMLDDDQTLEEYQENAKAATEKYNWENESKKLKQIYNSLD